MSWVGWLTVIALILNVGGMVGWVSYLAYTGFSLVEECQELQKDIRREKLRLGHFAPQNEEDWEHLRSIKSPLVEQWEEVNKELIELAERQSGHDS